jgi:hypothetical protein
MPLFRHLDREAGMTGSVDRRTFLGGAAAGAALAASLPGLARDGSELRDHLGIY